MSVPDSAIFSGCLYAVHLWHREVHQYEIGSKLVRLLDGIGTIHSFATNLPSLHSVPGKCAARVERADCRLQSKFVSLRGSVNKATQEPARSVMRLW